MWIDLTQPFHVGMPHSPALPAPEFETLRDVSEDGVNIQRYASATHVGTHVDAPRHFIEGGATIDELPVDRFAGEGVVVDVSRDGAEPIPVREVEAAPGADSIREGDVVAFHTGWGAKFDDPAYHEYPWFEAGVADWLLDRGVKLVAVDTISPDRPRALRPDGWDEYPLHYALLGAGVLIAEQLANLGPLAGRRVEFAGFPMKLRGGDGAPARFAARELP